MSFGGSAADMLYKMKYNQSLRDNNRQNYSRYHDAMVTYKKSRLKIEKENITKEELEKIKSEVIREVKLRNKKAIAISIIFTLIIALIVSYLIYWYMQSEISIVKYFF